MTRLLYLLPTALLACGGSGPPPSEPAPAPRAPAAAVPEAPSAPAAAKGDDQACSQDDDCVIVELGCCDHCNGGKVGAFNKDSAQRHRPTCGSTRCTMRACDTPVASCVRGRCTSSP